MERRSRQRRKPALSCVECRRRKVKCDRTDPCSHCVAAKIQCTYKFYASDPVARRQTPQSRLLDSTTSPSTNPGTQPSRANLPVRNYDTQRRGTPDHDDADRPDHSQEVEPDARDLLQRIRKLEQSSASNLVHGLSETGREILARQSGLETSQVILNKTRLLRSSHWVGTAHEFSTIVQCWARATGQPMPDDEGTSERFQAPEIHALVVQIGDLLQKTKGIAKSLKLGRPSRCLFCPGFGLIPPPRETADVMVALYLQNFESTHRILHIPTFWTEYQKYWDHPETVTTGVRLKILLAMGIGSSLYEHGDSDNGNGMRNMVHQWVYAAQSWLSGPLEKDRLEITGLQIHCLTIVARQIFSIGGDLVWMSMGSLIHTAMQMGLHRDPKHIPTLSVLQGELRRRLWATILELVVQSSLDCAMPPRISFDEYDTQPPSNYNDEEMDEAAESLEPHPKGTYTTTSMQLILLDSLPTRLRILQLLNGLHSDLSYIDVLSLSSQITEASRSCSMFLKENSSSNITPFQRNLLDYLVRRFMIPLHCPFAHQARTNPLYYYSLKTSLDTALAIISPESDEKFSRLMATGGGLFREGIRYAITVISFELLAQVESQRLDGTLNHKSQYRELLKQALRDMISLSTERIRLGETNIKSHMFLSMIMAQVEAVERGVPCEFEIAEKGRDSLEFCCGLLQERVNMTVSLPVTDGTGLTPSSAFGGGQDIFGMDMDINFFFSDTGFS